MGGYGRVAQRQKNFLVALVFKARHLGVTQLVYNSVGLSRQTLGGNFHHMQNFDESYWPCLQCEMLKN